jgi:hypothetical protein
MECGGLLALLAQRNEGTLEEPPLFRWLRDSNVGEAKWLDKGE